MVYEFLPFTPGPMMSGARTDGASKIMMIPGFMAGDASLYPLATALRAMGHRIFFAGIWSNMDCPRQTMERLSRALEGAFGTDGDKVVLVGHSLGGIYARELGRRFPQLVRRTMLLGSAIREPLHNSNPFVRMWFMATRRSHHEGGSCLNHLRSLCGTHRAEPVSAEIAQTIIYSRNDAVVDWRSCIESGPNIEAIEVRAGHNGMPLSPEVFAIVAQRARRGAAGTSV